MNKLKDIIAMKVIIERHFGSNALYKFGEEGCYKDRILITIILIYFKNIKY